MAKKIKVSIEIKNDSPYKPEFVKMIQQADEAFRNGKGRKVELHDIWKNPHSNNGI